MTYRPMQYRKIRARIDRTCSRCSEVIPAGEFYWRAIDRGNSLSHRKYCEVCTQ